MSQLQVDADTGELTITSGRLQRVSGGAEIVQGLRVRWRTIAGECVFAPGIGLPIFELNARVPTQRVEQLLTEQGLAVPGVVALDLGDPVLDNATRTLSVTFTGEGSLADLGRRVALGDQVTVPIG